MDGELVVTYLLKEHQKCCMAWGQLKIVTNILYEFGIKTQICSISFLTSTIFYRKVCLISKLELVHTHNHLADLSNLQSI